MWRCGGATTTAKLALRILPEEVNWFRISFRPTNGRRGVEWQSTAPHFVLQVLKLHSGSFKELNRLGLIRNITGVGC